jgi:outer membrane protein assembly factor BamB
MNTLVLLIAAIEGTVFVDGNANGVFDAGEAPLAGVTVARETAEFVVTGGDGRYRLEGSGPAIVWARSPEGFAVTPSWRLVQGSSFLADLGLRTWDPGGPLTFVHASDTHLGDVRDGILYGMEPVATRQAMRQATSLLPAPHFYTITGDITQDNSGPQFEVLETITRAIATPFLPVVGNHDYYDGGAAYRRFLGPTMYSFDVAGIHGVILDLLKPEQEIEDFLARDLANVPVERLRVAFTHAPREDWVDVYERHGIDYVFTGHWHSNRVIDYGTVTEVNTETLVMGGIDYTPAGYRVVTIEDGELRLSHHTIVETGDGGPYLAPLRPRPSDCVAPGTTTFFAAVEAGPNLRAVRVAVDGGPAIAMTAAGGWVYQAAVDVTAAGEHALRIEADVDAGSTRLGRHHVESTFCVGAAPIAPRPFDWPQLQGTAAHTGFSPIRIAPPLATAWMTAVGGHLRGGTPVVADGRVFVPVVDLADGSQGGVVALDSQTGAILWERRVGWSVHGTPAAVDGVVVFGSAEGVVHAVDAATGTPLWTHDLGEGLTENVTWLYAGPTVAEGLVYIGIQRRFAALDLYTGVEVWEVEPTEGVWLSSFASAAVKDGVVVAAFGRDLDGVAAWDAWDGSELWRLPQPWSNAVNASPLLDGDMLYLGNAATQVVGLDVIGAGFAWERQLIAAANEWSYGIAATPALAHGRLFVPTQFEQFVALDAGDGSVDWTVLAEPSVVHPVHYKDEARAFPSSPVVTGDLVWIGGADGLLRALDEDTGEALYTLELGAPMLSGPAPAGCTLYVATWDGTVRALVSQGACEAEGPPPAEACSCRAGRAPRVPGALALVVLFCCAVVVLRRR